MIRLTESGIEPQRAVTAHPVQAGLQLAHCTDRQGTRVSAPLHPTDMLICVSHGHSDIVTSAIPQGQFNLTGFRPTITIIIVANDEIIRLINPPCGQRPAVDTGRSRDFLQCYPLREQTKHKDALQGRPYLEKVYLVDILSSSHQVTIGKTPCLSRQRSDGIYTWRVPPQSDALAKACPYCIGREEWGGMGDGEE
ncbi:hypothetical protein P168DRAFT_278864 [Aspergillus campestris IBT 28561]|uniref:Uncharacterized protein n=1 Tax=Aspergillus campestris (strain IBT 28561) TaxID=1392248 RepID=A0A2I1DHM6_ASPC2|nr:uncharacterized protein P168DRAFT_278864 [Aspergillus campestris IBT 28561]PKY09376.1 hypothetical protein P168DRAFT_278864 [Aspergillus campestris IBT 28561]